MSTAKWAFVVGMFSALASAGAIDAMSPHADWQRLLRDRPSASGAVSSPSDGLQFRVSVYSDTVACSPSSLQFTQTLPANQCHDFTTHSSQWNCPAISGAPSCFTYYTYSDASCTVPVSQHINFCGECKESTLRVCTLDGQGNVAQVSFSNCTDNSCYQCANGFSRDHAVLSHPIKRDDLGMATLGVNQCYPHFDMLGYDTESAMLMPSTPSQLSCPLMYHQWWTGSGTCSSGRGWDYIALGFCNNGWMFECL